MLSDFLGPLVVLVVIVVGLVCGLPQLAVYGDRKECAYASTNANVETKFVQNHYFSWDCYVHVNGNWIPIDKWRGVQE